MKSIVILIFGIFAVFQSSEESIFLLRIEEGTSLKINGSTSISEYKCLTSYVPVDDTLYVKPDSGTLAISNGKIIFRIKEIECGDAYSNRQLINTLDGKRYPFILVELKNISQGNSWRRSKAQIKIELAGKERNAEVELELHQVEHNSLQFHGSKNFLMSSFNLKPPKPMLGMVEVNDTLNIEFDLRLKILQ